MARIWTLLIGYLLEAIESGVGRVMLALGVQAVTFTGINAALSYGVSYIQSSWASLPPIALQMLGALRVSQDIAIILGALAAKLAFKGLSGDSLTFWLKRQQLPKL